MSHKTEAVESLIRGPLIGTLVGLVLYGVTFLQAFFYFQTYVDDRMGLKLLDRILETAHAALSVFIMDYYLIAHYGQVQVLQSATCEFVSLLRPHYKGQRLLLVLTYTRYFTWRIWGFTKKMWIVIFMVMNVRSGSPSAKTTLVRYPSLYHERSGNQTRQPHSTHTLINRILIFVVATGAIIVLMDVVTLILILAQSESLAFTSAIFIQTRLYSNSLLASLNARKPHRRALHGRVDQSSIVELPPFSIRFAQQSDIRASAALQESQRTSSNTKSAESWHTAPEVATS
ncbi:hypothetical protein F5141DRAFT_1263437 [Pisolithus sp. B1]|nr:hypothetical protein F5141DRAFT_1263437 [Pisolithus sp. B1]